MPLPLIARFQARYGASAHLDPTELRESAAFLEGLSQPQPGTQASSVQRRFARAHIQLIRAARLVEMASEE